jgi:hypothetical protein
MADANAADARILFSSAFLDPRFGTGGHRRARQILELLSACGAGVATAAPARDSMVAGLRGAQWSTVLDYARGVRLGPLRRARVLAGFARNYGDARRGIARYPRARVLVWEDTQNAHMMRAAKDAGLRVIAVPQNLEALVPDQREARTGQTLPWSLEYEIKQLSLADQAFTISREEQWLLRLRGVDAAYLPFFPSAPERKPWAELRGQRNGSFDRYVVLGSAVNRPTRAGMEELLQWMRSTPDALKTPVHVIGYGTEAFRELSTDGLIVHGTLPDAELRAHLTRARAVLLHQVAAVGALIRVSEMLLAGIPIAVSAIAARSTSQYQGIAVYESLPQLGSLLRGNDWSTPPVPGAPDLLERQFVNVVEAWARDDRGQPA